MGAEVQKTKLASQYLRSRLARKMRAERVSLDELAVRIGRSMPWLSLALRGFRPMTRAQYEALRQALSDLLAERLQPARTRRQKAATRE